MSIHGQRYIIGKWIQGRCRLAVSFLFSSRDVNRRRGRDPRVAWKSEGRKDSATR